MSTTDGHRNDDYAEEIDLLLLCEALLRRLPYIMALGVLCGAIGFLAGRMSYTPSYKSTAMLYAEPEELPEDIPEEMLECYLYQDESLSNGYTALINSDFLIEKAVEKFGISVEPDEASGMTSVSNPSNTRFLYVAVTGSDAALSEALCNAIADTAAEIVGTIPGFRPVEILSYASVQNTSTAPATKKYALLGFFCGAFLAAGVVTLFFVLDDTVKTEEEAERCSGLRVIASIPKENMGGKTHRVAGGGVPGGGSGIDPGRDFAGGAKTSVRKRTAAVSRLLDCWSHDAGIAYSDAIDCLRTNILFFGGDVRTIVFADPTGACDTEKLVRFLAADLGKIGRKVLLVDAFLRAKACDGKYSSARGELPPKDETGIEAYETAGENGRAQGERGYIPARYTGEDRGLCGYLTGSAALEDIVHASENGLYTEIESGSASPDPAALLEMRRFKKLLKYAKNSFDYVLILTPPMDEAIDAAIAAGDSDGTVLVVKRGAARRPAVISALRTLEASGTELLGTVFIS